MTNEKQWHLDKRVPISFIVVLIVQIVAFVWGGALLYSQVQSNTAALVRLNGDLMEHEDILAHGTVASDLAGLKATQGLILEQSRQTNASLVRLNDRIDSVIRQRQ